MNQLSTAERPRRREYSAEFKTSVLEQCRQSGASIAGIALGHGINPNMVHRWMREDRQRLELIELQRGALAFVPLQLPPRRLLAQASQSACNPTPSKALQQKGSALRFNVQAAR
jgi:transposase